MTQNYKWYPALVSHMARASNGERVDPDMAKDALEYRQEIQPPVLAQFGRFYHVLSSVHFFLHALDDEDRQEHDPDFMEHVRASDPGAWDDATESVSALMDLLVVYVADEYPDEVVWTLDNDADVEVEV